MRLLCPVRENFQRKSQRPQISTSHLKSATSTRLHFSLPTAWAEKSSTDINIPLKKRNFDPAAFLATNGLGRKIVHLGDKDKAFSQGDPAESVFYIQSGRIRISVIARTGKEATVALLGPGEFCGEECIASAHPVRVASASAIAPCVLLKIDRREMIRVLRSEE